MKSTSILLVAIAIMVNSPVVATTQGSAAEEEGLVCVAIARNWVGDKKDLQNIRNVPVPKSFKDQYFAGGCTRFSLQLESLANWHMKHGTASSASKAIRFFENDLMHAHIGQPALFDAMNERWPVAAKEIEEYAKTHKITSKDLDGKSHYKVWPKLPNVEALLILSGRLSNTNFLAAEYARTAEHFRSPDLLTKAKEFHRSDVTPNVHPFAIRVSASLLRDRAGEARGCVA